jgi:sec-independent protein translocase protein TatA
MFAAGFGPPEIGLILIIVLVLFGGSQLPKLAKNLGKAQKEFKDGLAAGEKEAGKSADSSKASDE